MYRSRFEGGIPRVLKLTMLVALLVPAASDPSAAQPTFDHFTTGFRLEGAHRFAECESCHTDGVFEGTPTRCGDCHTQASRMRAAWQPATHIITSDRCDSCHRPNAWVAVARVDHLEVVGTCMSCHNGHNARSKPAIHVPAGDQCDDCHRTTAWVPAYFDHSSIVSGCFGCHNGMVAMGKPANHIPTTALCEDCHNTVMWSPVARMEHLQVLGTCSSCHNGFIATGQHPQHTPTTAECDTCHNTIAWR